MQVTINGESRSFPQAMTVEQVLRLIALDPGKVAVERNLEIVPRSVYGDVIVGDGDRLEIVHFIGGGSPDTAAPRLSARER